MMNQTTEQKIAKIEEELVILHSDFQADSRGCTDFDSYVFKVSRALYRFLDELDMIDLNGFAEDICDDSRVA